MVRGLCSFIPSDAADVSTRCWYIMNQTSRGCPTATTKGRGVYDAIVDLTVTAATSPGQWELPALQVQGSSFFCGICANRHKRARRLDLEPDDEYSIAASQSWHLLSEEHLEALAKFADASSTADSTRLVELTASLLRAVEDVWSVSGYAIRKAHLFALWQAGRDKSTSEARYPTWHMDDQEYAALVQECRLLLGLASESSPRDRSPRPVKSEARAALGLGHETSARSRSRSRARCGDVKSELSSGSARTAASDSLRADGRSAGDKIVARRASRPNDARGLGIAVKMEKKVIGKRQIATFLSPMARRMNVEVRSSKQRRRTSDDPADWSGRATDGRDVAPEKGARGQSRQRSRSRRGGVRDPPRAAPVVPRLRSGLGPGYHRAASAQPKPPAKDDSSSWAEDDLTGDEEAETCRAVAAIGKPKSAAQRPVAVASADDACEMRHLSFRLFSKDEPRLTDVRDPLAPQGPWAATVWLEIGSMTPPCSETLRHYERIGMSFCVPTLAQRESAPVWYAGDSKMVASVQVSFVSRVLAGRWQTAIAGLQAVNWCRRSLLGMVCRVPCECQQARGDRQSMGRVLLDNPHASARECSFDSEPDADWTAPPTLHVGISRARGRLRRV